MVASALPALDVSRAGLGSEREVLLSKSNTLLQVGVICD